MVYALTLFQNTSNMRRTRLPLRNRMFLAMLGLIVLSFLMTGAISFYFFKKENEEYNMERLKRKEYAIRATVDYFIRNHPQDLYVNASQLLEVFDERICELAEIHQQDIGFYDFDGSYVISSKAESEHTALFPSEVPNELLEQLKNSGVGTMKYKSYESQNYIFSASVVYDQLHRPIAILNFPYLIDERYEEDELREFFVRLSGIFALVFFVAVVIALFLSNSIARPLTRLREKISETRLGENKPIAGAFPPEIFQLAEEYNQMLHELHESAIKLAQRERQSAWRDMARQVAHEIKNPLTPMKLQMQMLAQRSDTSDIVREKLNGLVAQVDAMADIANAFSRYANLPELKRNPILIGDVINKAVSIFDDQQIRVDDNGNEKTQIIGDTEQLTRAFNNLIKNALQAERPNEPIRIIIRIQDMGDYVCVDVIDNGTGIPESEKDAIFEPRFTTKNSGMGLGLSIVKRVIEGLDGKISFRSELGKGSVFSVHLPKT